ncbi:MAG: sulfite exporter TauE/SafE family protein [Deltaproteobacteria bacterium]|nr:sulfite exporter TauE/SafE family protein [Deltaproteobacteria bacterium]
MTSVGELLALGGAGLVAGFINTLAGGGSLLTLPALMLTGLDASVANATNRIGVLTGSVAASHAFVRSRQLDPRQVARLAVPTLGGAALGALAAAFVPTAALEPILLATLVVMALVLALRPSILTASPGEAPREPGPRALVELAAAGFYAGFLQAGVGFILLAVLAGRLRHDLVRANALKVALVLPLTVVALGIFWWKGLVRWGPGLTVGVATAVGARLGVGFALRYAAALRWLVLAAVIVLAVAVALR